MLIGAVDETYIRSLRQKYVGYANITTLTILNHLYDSYARITAQDLKKMTENLMIPMMQMNQ